MARGKNLKTPKKGLKAPSLKSGISLLVISMLLRKSICKYCKKTRKLEKDFAKAVKAYSSEPGQLSFYRTFEEQLDHRHPLYILAGQIDWRRFEEAFEKYYSADQGRPAKPIRRMAALLILKHVRNLSDESVIEQWRENAYYQYLSGEETFTMGGPCEVSELVHFRHRIGEEGGELILQESIRLNGKVGQEDRGVSYTNVQEKNIVYPTDNELYRKIIAGCWKIAEQEII